MVAGLGPRGGQTAADADHEGRFILPAGKVIGAGLNGESAVRGNALIGKRPHRQPHLVLAELEQALPVFDAQGGGRLRGKTHHPILHMRRHGAQADGRWQGLGDVNDPRRRAAEEQTDEEQTKPGHGGHDQWRLRLKFQGFMPSTAPARDTAPRETETGSCIMLGIFLWHLF